MKKCLSNDDLGRYTFYKKSKMINISIQAQEKSQVLLQILSQVLE